MNINNLIKLVVKLVACVLILWLLFFLINYAGVPEPFNTVLKVILMIFAVLVVINMLLTLVGRPLFPDKE